MALLILEPQGFGEGDGNLSWGHEPVTMALIDKAYLSRGYVIHATYYLSQSKLIFCLLFNKAKRGSHVRCL